MLQISNLRRCKNVEMRSSERLAIGVLFRHTTYQAWRTFEWILLAKLTKNHSLYHYGFHPLLVTKPCEPRLYSSEWDLRHAQANDSLHDLRRYLQLRSHLYKHKDRFSSGQRANTRANLTISRVQRHINASVAQYRAAWKALQNLAPHLKKDDAWMQSLPELRNEDVRPMNTGLEGESEGRRSLSWIWRSDELASGSEHLHECRSYHRDFE